MTKLLLAATILILVISSIVGAFMDKQDISGACGSMAVMGFFFLGIIEYLFER